MKTLTDRQDGPALSRPLSLVMALSLAGCAAVAPPAHPPLTAPPQWYAPQPSAGSNPTATSSSLPHQGSLAGLSQWWQQQNDALLVELIEAGQAASPTVSTARSNIEQARSTRAQSQAALLPTLDGTGTFTRSRGAPFNGVSSPPTNTGQIGLATSWEVDVFGRNRATRDAGQERLDGAQAQWHDARVSVAAEVANQYYSLRACQRLLLVSRADAQSRGETARLTGLATRAGFEAPATAALARASAAESNSRTTQQAAQCELDIKALVGLTALDEPALRQKLAAAPAETPQQGIAAIPAIPAEVLSQRPDVFNAAREVTAASFEVTSANALRYPSLTLNGSVTEGRTRVFGNTASFDTWSIGPLSLRVPLYDGGASKAYIDAARARYEDAASKYRSTARQAVREVEEALVNLQSTADRTTDAATAADGYRASFAGTEARYKAGLASLVELEDSRRTLLSAQSAVVSLERERRSAWIALYRALGGGWTVAAPAPAPMVFSLPESTASARP